LGILGPKPPKYIFCNFFAPQGRLSQPIFLKFTGFMCSCLSIGYTLNRFIKIWYINQGFISEKPRVGCFFPKFRGRSPKTRSRISNQLSMETCYGRPLSTCQVWWRSVYARRRENENKSFCVSFCVCLSRCVWPILVLQSCRDVRQFNEVQLRHLLINFLRGLGRF